MEKTDVHAIKNKCGEIVAYVKVHWSRTMLCWVTIPEHDGSDVIDPSELTDEHRIVNNINKKSFS